ncbi:MAG: hypothetical protein ACRCY9_21130 [Phycicoccus sp.]
MPARRARARLAALLAATAVTTGATAAAVPAEAAPALANAIVIGGAVTKNASVADDSNARIEVSGSRAKVDVRASRLDLLRGGASVSLLDRPGDGEMPVSGEHVVAPGTPLQLWVHGENVSCALWGRVVIHALAFADEGKPTSMALDWTGDCDGQRSGQVRVDSDVPYGGIDVEPQHTWPVSNVGEVSDPSGTQLVSSQSPISTRGQFVAREGRLLDTRARTAGRKGTVRAGQAVTLKVAGVSGVPATGVGAVVLNVTAIGPTTPSFVSVYSGGSPRPTTSSLNTTRDVTAANLVTVPLSATGTVSFYNQAGSVHLVADLVGYYSMGPTMAAAGSDFFVATPERVVDSRTASGQKLEPREYFPVQLDFRGYRSRITGFAVTITSTGSTGAGFLSALPTRPNGTPTTSSVNYLRGTTVANLAVVRTPQQVVDGETMPTFWIANSGSASTHVIVDVVGFFVDMKGYGSSGLRFRPQNPTRVLDTRSDLGAPTVGTNADTRVPAPPSMLGRETRALVGNLAGVTPSASTYLTMWGGGERPPVSSLTLTKGVTRSNAVWTGVGDGYRPGYTLYNHVGATETIYDVTGTFEQWPPSRDTLAGVPLPPTSTARADAGASARDTGQVRLSDLRPVRRVERPTVSRY